jgi:hypothetical protein
MQERYCECGYPILVSYLLLAGKSWAARFWAGSNYLAKTVDRCPRCGRSLKVDMLH